LEKGFKGIARIFNLFFFWQEPFSFINFVANQKEKAMSVLMEFAMFPTDKGESVSPYVSRIIKMIDESGLEYKLTPMGTVVEAGSIQEILGIIEKAHKVLDDDCSRIYSTIKLDIRKGAENRLEGKVKSVEEKIGKVKK